MSNFDRAVEALNDVDVIYGALVGNEDYATVLEERGLLAPDLPEPYPYSGEVPCWYEGAFRAGISSAFGGQKPNVTFANSEPGGVVHMDSESARELALMLLAAAEHAEKEQDNE